MRSSPAISRPPRSASDTAQFRGLGLLSRELWFGRAMGRAVAGAIIASASGCGGETVSPSSDEIGVSVVGPGRGVFELDSIQYAAWDSRGRRLKAGQVTWSVSVDGLATISANGVLKAIRATDFDLPANTSGPPNVIAKAGTHSASMFLSIYGWEKPRAPELDSVAYLKDEAYQSTSAGVGMTLTGLDQTGEPFTGTGSLVLTCGTAVAGHWTVEISPESLDLPLIAPARELYPTDTVSVAFDGEVPRLERWQRVGIRLRAPDGDDMVRRMLRARRLAMTAQSYTSTSYVYDGLLKFSFRLGNVKQVTEAAIFRACH